MNQSQALDVRPISPERLAEIRHDDRRPINRFSVAGVHRHELLLEVDRLTADLDVARHQRSLGPGMVWQDYYSPDEVVRIRTELEEENDRLRKVLTQAEAALAETVAERDLLRAQVSAG